MYPQWIMRAAFSGRGRAAPDAFVGAGAVAVDAALAVGTAAAVAGVAAEFAFLVVVAVDMDAPRRMGAAPSVGFGFAIAALAHGMIPFRGSILAYEPPPVMPAKAGISLLNKDIPAEQEWHQSFRDHSFRWDDRRKYSNPFPLTFQSRRVFSRV
jgi:hypothetical protein